MEIKFPTESSSFAFEIPKSKGCANFTKPELAFREFLLLYHIDFFKSINAISSKRDVLCPREHGFHNARSHCSRDFDGTNKYILL